MTDPHSAARLRPLPLATILLTAACAAATAPATSAARPDDPPVQTKSTTAAILEGYRDHAALLAAARALAASSGANVEVVPLGTSRGGRELIALHLHDGDAANRPAILVVAGLDGIHLAGAEVALRVAAELVGDATKTKRPDLLKHASVWIVPCVNPDALEATLKGPLVQRGTLRPVDDDRDGAVDEDGPRDLDGDGVVVEMRVKNPPSPYVATLVADPADGRILKAPETGVAAKPFEAPVFAVFTEGDDADHDGRIAEDGVGEVDLDRNFPHRYPEFARDAGPHQLCEPESRALAEFVVAHPEIVAAVTYGRHDSLVKVPEGRDNDATGRTPLVHGGSDVDLYQAIGKLYRDTTGQQRSGGVDHEGSFWIWLADHRGILSVASTVWGRPDLPKPEAPAEGGAGPAAPAAAPAAPAQPPATQPPAPQQPTELRPNAAMEEVASAGDEEEEELHTAGFQSVPASQGPGAQGAPAQGGSAGQGGPAGQGGQGPGAGQGGPPGGGRGGFPGGAGGGRGGRRGGGMNFQARGGPAPAQGSATSDAESADWLAYSDKMRGGVGFVPWHDFLHPVFGMVEIGGFHPLFKWNPPSADLDALASKQVAFLLELVDRLPALTCERPVVTKLADGLVRIETSVTNTGRLPTVTSIGATTRARESVIARISTDLDRVLSGERVRRIESIAPGARIGLEWIVRCPADETIEISIGNHEYGTTVYHVRDAALVEENSR